MSDSNSSNMGSNPDTTKVTYSNFYELLGVDQDENADVIESRGRQLLAKNHPDTSSRENAKEIYKTLNRAQVVLTDPDQREIYDRLGHTEYISRREKDGSVSQSGTISTSGFTPANNIGSQNGADEPKTTSTERNERNTTHKDVSSGTEGYGSLTDIDESSNAQDSMWRIFRQIWFVRIVMAGLVLGLGVHAATVSGSPVPSIFIDNLSSTVTGSLSVISTVIIGVTVIATGALAYAVLKSVEDTIELQSSTDKVRRQRQEDASRGYNVNSPDNPTQGRTSDWDLTTQQDTLADERTTPGYTRSNPMLKYGTRMLAIGAVILGAGTLPTGMSPLQYLYLSLTTEPEVPLWIDVGIGSQPVQLLINSAVGVVVALVCFIGLLALLNGVSKEVWHRHYLTPGNYLPFLWDTLMSIIVTLGILGAIFGREPVTSTAPTQLPQTAIQMLAATDGMTGLSLFVASVVIALATSIGLKCRAIFGGRVG